jgi:hypothetical protein
VLTSLFLYINHLVGFIYTHLFIYYQLLHNGFFIYINLSFWFNLYSIAAFFSVSTLFIITIHFYVDVFTC